MKKPTKEDKKLMKHQTLKKYRHKKHFSYFDFRFYKELYKYKYKKKSIFLMIMLLRNGKYNMFTTTTASRYFTMGGGTYFIDQDMTRRDIHSGMNTLFYHQDCAIPFKIDFNLDELTTVIKDGAKDSSIIKALNPTSLRGFIDSEVIEKVLKGQGLSEQLRKMYMIIIITLVMSVISVILVARSQGWI